VGRGRPQGRPRRPRSGWSRRPRVAAGGRSPPARCCSAGRWIDRGSPAEDTSARANGIPPGRRGARAREGFAAPICHVIVRESLEVPVADRRSIADGQVEDRAAAFTRLAEGHLDASYRLARAILRDPAEAEDATHDAYVQAWRKWSTLRDPSRFEAW